MGAQGWEMVDLIKAVREHAAANYEQDGWDFLVECYSDDDIKEAIGGATTVAGAIRNVKQVVKVLADRRADVQAEF
jgi:hypothetical protein